MVGNIVEYISGTAHHADECITLNRFAAHVSLCTSYDRACLQSNGNHI